jgi:mannose-6-phosphate isomerase-like protein (cupin superfamily)
MGILLSTSKERKAKLNSTKALQTVCLNAADIKELQSQGYSDREHGKCSWKTLISSDKTPSNSLTCGIATLPPKRENQPASAGGNLAQHRHRHAEIYIVLSGEAIVNVDMLEYPVQAGSVLFIPGNAEHAVRNTSLVDEFVWYYCFAADSYGDVRYFWKNDQLRLAVPGAS